MSETINVSKLSDAIHTPKWVRQQNSWLAGVCSGLAKALNLEPWMVRFFWILSVCWFGLGLGLYVILAICLPREDKLSEANQKKFLGLCLRIAQKNDLEVGIVRTIAVLLALGSLGTGLLVYVLLSFAMGTGDRV